MTLPTLINLAVPAIAVIVYVVASFLWRRYKYHEPWSIRYLRDDRNPNLVGVGIVATAALAIASSVSIALAYMRYMSVPPAQRVNVKLPEYSLEIVVLGTLAVVWISLMSILDAVRAGDAMILPRRRHTLTRAPNEAEAETYLEANLDLDRHKAEVRQAIERKGGVTTAQLLTNLESAAKESGQ